MHENHENLQLIISIDLKTLKDKTFLEEFGVLLLNALGAKDSGKQVDVTKIKVNSVTYNAFSDKLLAQIQKSIKSKSIAKKQLSWALLQFGPCIDYHNAYNCEDGKYYIEVDCLKQPREQ